MHPGHQEAQSVGAASARSHCGHARPARPDPRARLSAQAPGVAEQRAQRAHVRAGCRVVQRVAPLRVVHREHVRAQRQQVRCALGVPAWAQTGAESHSP